MKKITFLFSVLATVQVGHSQGSFQNLNFESANVVGDQPSQTISIANAFPGWQASSGTTSIESAFYDAYSAGSAVFAIMDDKNGFTPIQGNYTAILQAAVVGSASASITLSQSGTVPSGTESIQLDASQSQDSSFVVSVDGNAINMVPLQTFANYTLYGGSLSAWAGQDVSLSITELPPGNQAFSPTILELDNIIFSPQSVPEPGPFVLTGVGGILFTIYRRLATRLR